MGMKTLIQMLQICNTGPVTIWGIWGKELEINYKKVTAFFLCTCDVVHMASWGKIEGVVLENLSTSDLLSNTWFGYLIWILV